MGLIDNKSALVSVIAWPWTCDKRLPQIIMHKHSNENKWNIYHIFIAKDLWLDQLMSRIILRQHTHSVFIHFALFHISLKTAIIRFKYFPIALKLNGLFGSNAARCRISFQLMTWQHKEPELQKQLSLCSSAGIFSLSTIRVNSDKYIFQTNQRLKNWQNYKKFSYTESTIHVKMEMMFILAKRNSSDPEMKFFTI